MQREVVSRKNLFFAEPVHLEYAKIGIMFGSFFSGVIGYIILRKP